MKERLGFIGLGAMGSRMALSASRIYEVSGFDLNVPAKRLTDQIRIGRSVAEVGALCEIVCLSLPNSEAVEEVVSGGDGLGNAMAPGGVIIDLSTTEPNITVRLARELASLKIEYVDAPVSGGVGGAENGTLSVMVGASERSFERVRPVLEAIGRDIVRVGDVGAGGVAKLANNMIVGAAFASIAESFALASKAGIRVEKLYEAIKGGWAGSAVLDVSAKAMIERDYSPTGTVKMLAKDMSYARR